MIRDVSETTTWPDDLLSLDAVYYEAQEMLWSKYFGDLFTWALFALLLVQVYFYYINYPDDKRWTRLLVLALFLIETASTAFITWAGYKTIIEHWGHSPYISAATFGSMMFDCTVASIVHGLYAFRVSVLYHRRWFRDVTIGVALASLIMLLSSAQWASCMVAALYNALQGKQGPGKRFIARKFFRAWLVIATVDDVLITALLVFKLYSSRSGTNSTSAFVKKLLYVIIPCGFLTAFVTLMILITELRWVGSNYYQFLIIVLSKLYTNSVLLCFNLRPSRKKTSRHTVGTSIELHSERSNGTSRVPLDGIRIDSKLEQTGSSPILCSVGHGDGCNNSKRCDALLQPAASSEISTEPFSNLDLSSPKWPEPTLSSLSSSPRDKA